RANANGGGHLALASNCTYTLSVGTAGNGLPPVTVPLTIDGNDARIERAAGADAFRFLAVQAGGVLLLNDTTLTGGQAPTGEPGGAILVSVGGTAFLTDVELFDNRGPGGGGAIENAGVLTVRSSTLSRNAALNGENGGAIRSSGVLTVTGSTIFRNVAGAG